MHSTFSVFIFLIIQIVEHILVAPDKSFTVLLQVMPVGFVATERSSDGVYVDGLQLANAAWDSSRSVLMELLPGDEALQPLPPVWIRPLNTNSESQQLDCSLYTCPLFSCTSIDLQQDNSLLTHVPLPTFHPPSLWAQKRVALACSELA